ncbi:MAG: hypothetical protein PCFJNLEI_03109 [Verrucomicrobiae bacterium]|nr:hypothetical protein [Verrucomicrobiae bacterium]
MKRRPILRVLRGTLRHLELMLPLFRSYLEFYHVPASVPAARRFLRARLRRGDSQVYLAFLGDSPVGFMQLYPTFSSLAMRPAWLLSDLFVAPTGRRRGVATALLQRAHRLGETTGAAELALETARTNHPAQRLYAGLGWCRDDKFLVYRRTCRRRK